MSQRKTKQLSVRVSELTRQLLELAAARDHRNISNMLEHLVLQHCERAGIALTSKTTKKRNAR